MEGPSGAARWRGPSRAEYGGLQISFVIICIEQGTKEQRLAPGRDSLHVGAITRHSLDRLNASNDFFKKKKKKTVSISNPPVEDMQHQEAIIYKNMEVMQ